MKPASDLRHTFCAWTLRAGISLFLLSRIMGTSIALLDSTYGHFVPDSEEHIRGLLGAGDRERMGHVRATEADLKRDKPANCGGFSLHADERT